MEPRSLFVTSSIEPRPLPVNSTMESRPLPVTGMEPRPLPVTNTMEPSQSLELSQWFSHRTSWVKSSPLTSRTTSSSSTPAGTKDRDVLSPCNAVNDSRLSTSFVASSGNKHIYDFPYNHTVGALCDESPSLSNHVRMSNSHVKSMSTDHTMTSATLLSKDVSEEQVSRKSYLDRELPTKNESQQLKNENMKPTESNQSFDSSSSTSIARSIDFAAKTFGSGTKYTGDTVAESTIGQSHVANTTDIDINNFPLNRKRAYDDISNNRRRSRMKRDFSEEEKQWLEEELRLKRVVEEEQRLLEERLQRARSRLVAHKDSASTNAAIKSKVGSVLSKKTESDRETETETLSNSPLQQNINAEKREYNNDFSIMDLSFNSSVQALKLRDASDNLSQSRIRRLQEMNWMAEEEMIRAAAQLERRRLEARSNFAKKVVPPKTTSESIDSMSETSIENIITHDSLLNIQNGLRPTREHNSLFDADFTTECNPGPSSPRSDCDSHGGEHRAVLSDSISLCSDSEYILYDYDSQFSKLRRKWIAADRSRLIREDSNR